MSITAKEIKERLFELADEDYKKFQSKLVPDNDTILGVRMPILRKYAKELLRRYPVNEIIEALDDTYYEERMLQGLLIGLQPKSDLEEVLRQTEAFLPKIDNWAVCDLFCSGLKIVKVNRRRVFEWMQPYVDAEDVFARRFVLVILLNYYMDEEYVDEIFRIIDRMELEAYYVQMAAAWALSVALVKMYDRTWTYLESCELDDFTYRKTIQKAMESYRITREQKLELRNRIREKGHNGR